MIKYKRRAYKVAQRTQKEKDHQSNVVRNMTRKDHRSHIDKITLNLHNNQRSFWRWLKNIRGGNPVLTLAQDKANALNKYFCSVFANENTSNLTELESLTHPFLSNTSIESLNISEEDVYDELCKIDPSKASGPDETPGKILKQCAHWLSEPLTKLFTMSLQTGKLPQDWRSANIAPVFNLEINIIHLITGQLVLLAW